MNHLSSRVLASVFLAGGVALVGAGGATADPAERVTLCHATGTPDDNGNRFVVISPSETGDVRGHANWDFKDHVPTDNGHTADIIPPFTYTDRDGDHEFPGQNWDDEGQAIYDEGTCEGTWTPPTSTSTTSTSTTSTSTTSTSTSTTPSTSTSTSMTPSTSTSTSTTPTTTSTTTTPTSTSTSTSTSTTPTPTSTSTSTSTTTQPTTTGTSTATTPVAPSTPGGPQTPGVVQTDGGPMGGGDSLLTALGLAALMGAAGTVITVGARAAARRH